jgi:hypothetical protein
VGSIISILGIGLLIGCIYILPTFLVQRTVGEEEVQKLGAEKQLKAQNDVRATLLQGLGGAVLLAGAFFTWRQIQVNREGQNTDRFTQAIEQLGKPEIDIRIGGIYALGRLADNSKPDRAAIARILSAFVREHSPLTNDKEEETHSGVDKGPSEKREEAVDPQTVQELQGGVVIPDADILAALDVLGSFNETTGSKVLGTTDLRHAKLDGNFEGTDFTGSDLSDAYCYKANMRSAKFRWTTLNRTRFIDADLRYAEFDDQWGIGAGSDLQGAFLFGANLRGAHLDGANLKGALADSTTKWPTAFNRDKAISEGVVFDERRYF